MSDSYLHKFTSAYIDKFFKDRELPHESWEIRVDGKLHVVDNTFIIESILRAPAAEQKMIAEALHSLDADGHDINVFLKHLAFESSLLSQVLSH